jgi:hypothetical protein
MLSHKISIGSNFHKPANFSVYAPYSHINQGENTLEQLLAAGKIGGGYGEDPKQ